MKWIKFIRFEPNKRVLFAFSHCFLGFLVLGRLSGCCHFTAVLSWLYCPGGPVLAVLPSLSCPGGPVLVVLSWLSKPDGLVLTDLFRFCYSGCPSGLPLLVILFFSSYCLVLTCSNRHIFGLTYFSCPFKPVLVWLSCSCSPFFTVLSWHPTLAVLALLGNSVLEVYLNSACKL